VESNPNSNLVGSIESLKSIVVWPNAGTVIFFISAKIFTPLLFVVSVTSIVLSQGSLL